MRERAVELVKKYAQAYIVWDSMIDDVESALLQARREALTEAAKEADYYSKNSKTALNIAKAIRERIK